MDIRGLPFLTSPSLKTRMAIVVVALVLVTTILVTSVSLVLAKRGMKEVIGDQQYTLLSRVADEIDQKFYTRQIGLQSIADGIPRENFQDATQLQRYVEQHAYLKVLFDNLWIVNAQGELLANLNDPASRGKLNVANRAYFKDTMATRRGVISAPLRGALTQKPVVVITAPILDPHGNIALIAGGTIALDHDNFLGQIARMKIGQTGYAFAVTNDGVVVAHPKKSLLLQQAETTAGINPGLDRALAGYEGTIEAGNRSGVYGLFSYKRIKSTNWILGAVYPEADAFASISDVEKKAILAATLLAILVGPLAWWIARRQIAPLQQLHAHIQDVRQNPGTALTNTLHRGDEIGRLARAFDNLMSERLAAEAKSEASAAEMRNNRAFLQSLIDYMPVLVFSKSMRPDDFGQMIMWNEAAEAITGYAAQNVIGKTDREIFPLKMAQIFEERDRTIVANPAPLDVAEYPFRRADGSVRYLHAITLPIFDEHDRVEYILGIAEDVTARRAAEQALVKSEQRLRLIADNIPALIAYVDPDQGVAFGNRQYEQAYGVSYEEIEGKQTRDVLGPEVYAQSQEHILNVLAGTAQHFERFVARSQRWERVSYIPDIDAQGAVAGFFSLVEDITELKQVENQLRILVRFDSLTGLSNRLQFDEKLAEAIARSRRSGRQMAVMFLDIDHFKSINDTLGHHGGDEVLREFAQRLLGCVRNTDTVARLAGDEFVIILEGLKTPEETSVVANKIIQAMAHDFQILGMMRHVTTSIGIAIRQEEEIDAEALLRRADEALYRAKSAGRDTFKGPVA